MMMEKRIFITARKIRLLVLSIFLCIPLGTLFYIGFKKMPEMINHFLYNAGKYEPGTFNPEMLSHRLVKEDVRLFPDHAKIATLAWGNINDFLKASSLNCSGIKDARKFLSCSNDLLGDKFYYKANDLTSEGWSRHASDCDLNVYLLYDAAKQNGIELKIVYFPSHALIAFRDDKDENWIYWETTLHNNHGGIAETNDPLYIKSPDRFFDTPIDMSMAEMIYPLMIIPHIHKDSVAIHEFNQLSTQLKNTPYYKDIVLLITNLTTPFDIKQLHLLMAQGPTSTAIKYIAAQWYIGNNMKAQAEQLLSTISLDKCPRYCINLLSDASVFYKPEKYIAGILDWSEIDVSREDVCFVYLFSLLTLSVSTLIIFLNRNTKK